MIQSMTGYGKAVVAFKEKKINVEVKSLNSKQLDLQTRIAPLYREKEMEIRQLVSTTVVRGKVDFCLWVERDMTADATPINATLVENYYQQMNCSEKSTHQSAPYKKNTSQAEPLLSRTPSSHQHNDWRNLSAQGFRYYTR